jgi:hypothetical protein
MQPMSLRRTWAENGSMLINNRILQSIDGTSTEVEPDGPRHLTASQGAALRRLADLISLQGLPEKAGVAVRNKPLMVGPSGTGKTALVRRLASLERLPLLVINAASWIVYGATTTPHTLTVVRRFVSSNPRSIIFIDELDKIAHGEATFSHPWSSAVLAEILATLDADKKLGACGWKDSDIEHLRKSCFVCGAGAWQLHAAQARQEKNLSYADRILEEAGIPEEVLFRFNSSLVEIRPPKESDFRAAIRRIRGELSLPNLPATEETCLVGEALQSHRGMRWVEQYLADLLIAHPSLCEIPEDMVNAEGDKSSELKLQISRADYNVRLEGALKLMTDLQRPVLELSTKMRLAQQIVAQTPPDEKPPVPAADYQLLVESIENFCPSLAFGTSFSPAQRHRRETEMHVHGMEVIHYLEPWLRDRAYTLRAHGILDTALSVQVMVKRLLATHTFLAKIQVEE